MKKSIRPLGRKKKVFRFFIERRIRFIFSEVQVRIRSFLGGWIRVKTIRIRNPDFYYKLLKENKLWVGCYQKGSGRSAFFAEF